MSNIKEITKLVYALSTNEERAGAINEKFLELVERVEKMYRESEKGMYEKHEEYCEAFELLVNESDKRVKSYIAKIQKDYDSKVSELDTYLNILESKVSDSEVELKDQIKEAKVELKEFSSRVLDSHKSYRDDTVSTISELVKKSKTTFEKLEEKTDKFNKDLETFKSELNQRINNAMQGGGSMNRQIFVGGTNPLTRYTDYNIIAGTGITITTANDDTNRRVNLTITSSGGAGNFEAPSSGAVDDSNTVFTFANDSIYLIINGAQYIPGTGIYSSYDSGTKTATLSSAVGSTGFFRSA
jgi:hypothetical protein